MKLRNFFSVCLGILFCLNTLAATRLSDKTHHRIELLTNIFENESLDYQYGYIKNLHDGRGYTAGRIGFTTQTGDLVEVVEKYSHFRPGNLLEKYLPLLHRLADTEDGQTSSLRGFVKAWKSSADETPFQKAQDDLVESMYFKPALARAEQLGVKSPLAIGLIYDTLIQHGDGDEPDGFLALAKRTNEITGGAPSDGVDEQVWFQEFANVRIRDLNHPYNSDTQEAWKESVGRVYCYLELSKANYWNLDKKIHIHVFGFDGDLP